MDVKSTTGRNLQACIFQQYLWLHVVSAHGLSQSVLRSTVGSAQYERQLGRWQGRLRTKPLTKPQDQTKSQDQAIGLIYIQNLVIGPSHSTKPQNQATEPMSQEGQKVKPLDQTTEQSHRTKPRNNVTELSHRIHFTPGPVAACCRWMVV